MSPPCTVNHTITPVGAAALADGLCFAPAATDLTRVTRSGRPRSGCPSRPSAALAASLDCQLQHRESHCRDFTNRRRTPHSFSSMADGNAFTAPVCTPTRRLGTHRRRAEQPLKSREAATQETGPTALKGRHSLPTHLHVCNALADVGGAVSHHAHRRHRIHQLRIRRAVAEQAVPAPRPAVCQVHTHETCQV